MAVASGDISVACADGSWEVVYGVACASASAGAGARGDSGADTGGDGWRVLPVVWASSCPGSRASGTES
jgi:hypothetical protein